jgi:hypothetical protein
MSDPLLALRAYRTLAPWSLRALTSIAAAILRTSGVTPINAAASPVPTERTVRFYVTRGLVTAPDGRGTAATYGYRHLLHVLMIKLRQMEGATLSTIDTEVREMTGDVLERRVAAALGDRLPPPSMLPLDAEQGLRGGRAGRALGTVDRPPDGDRTTHAPGQGWRRIAVTDGIELHVRDDRLRHVGQTDEADLVATLRRLLDAAGAEPAE